MFRPGRGHAADDSCAVFGAQNDARGASQPIVIYRNERLGRALFDRPTKGVWGIAAERLEIRGYGEDRPIVPNETAADRARNRRIEFVFEG